MINFQLTPFDILEFNKHFTKKNANFLQKYLHWIILFFFVTLFVFLLQHNNASKHSYIMLAVLVVAMVFIQKAFSQFFRRKNVTAYLKENPKVIGNRVMKFDTKKLIVTIEGADSVYPFADFTKLEESKFHYFAYVNNQSAVIIPKRLEKEKDFSKIIDKIKATSK